jgi:hypothetical protein
MAENTPQAETPTAGAAKDQPGPFQGFAQTTSRVVQQAASILEEEIAAGIVAAKQIEGRFVNVDQLRSGKPEEVMLRLRRDAHDVLDIFVDLVQVAVRGAQNLVQRVITVRTTLDGKKRGESAPAVPALTLPQPLKPGQADEAPLSLENESDTATVEFSLRSSDLTTATGESIAQRYVTFKPGSLVIPARQKAQVLVGVEVPKNTPPGLYSGLLVATKLDHLRAVLLVQVD